MKKLALIIGALAVLIVGALTAIAYSVLNNSESEANKAKTEPARKARWAEKEVKEEAKQEAKPAENETQK